MRLVLSFSPSKLDSAIALGLRVNENAPKFAGYNPQGIAWTLSLQTPQHQEIADLLNNEVVRFQRRSLLREIARNGNRAQMKRLIGSQPNADLKAIIKDKADCKGKTLLMSACSNNNTDMVEFLLSEGARIHARDRSHKSAMHYAACGNSREVIDILLKNGASIHDTDQDGLNALHHAAEQGHYETVKLLVERGCHVEKKTMGSPTTSIPESNPRFSRSAGMTPFHFAAQNGHNNVVELLMKKGVDVNCKTARGWTALMLASQSGRVETVSLLLRLGSNVAEQDVSSNSALQYAARERRLEIAQVLIGNGADVNRDVNKKDMEKLLVLAARKRKPKLLEVLLINGYGARFSPTCFVGEETLLHTATGVEGNAGVVEILLRHGADIHARDKHGMTALHCAADVKTAELLVLAGCDLSATDNCGEVAAFNAARSNRWKLVEYFVRQGCEVNTPSPFGFTLLQLLDLIGSPMSFD